MKKIFTSETTFVIFTLLGVVGCACLMLSNLLSSLFGYEEGVNYINLVIRLLEAVCLVALFVSYWKHNKNLMKGVIGVLLTLNFVVLFDYIQYVEGYGNTADWFFLVFTLAVNFIFSVNHFVINSRRRSSPANITINQISAILLLLIGGLAWGISDIISGGDWTYIVFDIFEILAFIGVITVIVCVESRLDAYRIDREAAGWTEEAGYPEGYVHNSER